MGCVLVKNCLSISRDPSTFSVGEQGDSVMWFWRVQSCGLRRYDWIPRDLHVSLLCAKAKGVRQMWPGEV